MICETCHNEYSKAFTITLPDGSAHIFDSFECAINALAPRCAHCRCVIIGHGHQAGELIFCCAHCANQKGFNELRDNSSAKDSSAADSISYGHSTSSDKSEDSSPIS